MRCEHMEIEIGSKRNNPLLNRTEVHFTVRHEGKGTPDRELIRSELAEKLNVKRENVIVHTIHSSFGDQEITGYAKIYTSGEKSKDWERDHILKRNKIGVSGKNKEEKKPEEAPAGPKEKTEKSAEKPPEEKPSEPTEEADKEEKPTEEPPKVGEQPTEETPKTEEEKPAEEQKTEEPTKEEAGEPEKTKEQPEQPAESPKDDATEETKGEEKPGEEKKE